MVAHACHPSYERSLNRRIMALGINVRPYLKSNQSKKSWGMAQVIEHLHSSWKALNSNPSITTKKRKKEKKS
jgi:hypothetical protein